MEWIKIYLETWEASLGVCLLLGGISGHVMPEVVPAFFGWGGMLTGLGMIAGFYASFPVWRWARR